MDHPHPQRRNAICDLLAPEYLYNHGNSEPHVSDRVAHLRHPSPTAMPFSANPSLEEKVEECKPTKSETNWVIMDYLVSEGYPGAAEKFAQETNISLPTAPQEIRERVLIRNAIYAGNMEQAIEMINEMDIQILDHNHVLHFQLLQLQLIEIIRFILANPDTTNATRPYAFEPAIAFAQEQLAPRVPTGKIYQQALERTMSLMMFPSDKMPKYIEDLLDPALRAKIASEVNRAILESRGERPEAKIRQLVRARVWAESLARDAKIDNLPSSRSLGLDQPMTTADAMVS